LKHQHKEFEVPIENLKLQHREFDVSTREVEAHVENLKYQHREVEAIVNDHLPDPLANSPYLGLQLYSNQLQQLQLGRGIAKVMIELLHLHSSQLPSAFTS